jgi:hypothetical protein
VFPGLAFGAVRDLLDDGVGVALAQHRELGPGRAPPLVVQRIPLAEAGRAYERQRFLSKTIG